MRTEVFSFFGQYRFKNGKQAKNRFCLTQQQNLDEQSLGQNGCDYGILFCQAHDKSVKQLSNLIQMLTRYESLNILQLTNHISTNDISLFIDDYASSARGAFEAGFDGVEIQGNDGLLMNNHGRIAEEIIKACRCAVPKEFLIGFRLLPENLPEGVDIDDNLQIAEKLVQNGMDFMTLSLSNVLLPSTKYLHLSHKPILAYFRERLGNHYPLFVAGNVQEPNDAQKALESGASFVALTPY